jgi:hypothetical protein
VKEVTSDKYVEINGMNNSFINVEAAAEKEHEKGK